MGCKVIVMRVRWWGVGEVCCQGHLEWVVHAGGRCVSNFFDSFSFGCGRTWAVSDFVFMICFCMQCL